MSVKRNALGRGLDTLIPMDDVPARGTSAINDIPLDSITPNPDQPRKMFDDEALEELAASVRQLGIIQPLSLRKTGPDSYQIIAGERRYRAALMAGLTSVPAYIRTANDLELTEMALIENIQREDLNAIEIALTFRKLIDQYNLTQEEMSKRIGKKRATVANFLRLLRLPAEVQLGLRDKLVDMGHARALLSISDPALQLKLYNEILKQGLSVRRVEELAKQYENGDAAAKSRRQPTMNDSDYDVLKRHLSSVFRTPVQFSCNKQGRGRITFQFKDESELERLITLFDSLKMNNIIHRFIAVTLLFAGMLFVAPDVWSQEPHMPVKKPINLTDTIAEAPDSVEIQLGSADISTELPDSIAALLDESPYDRWEPRETEFNPDPTRAVWMSALFPGLGQLYNRRYWKLPIIIGGYLGLGYATSWNNGMLNDYTRAYRDIMDNDPSTNSYMNFFPPNTQESDLDRTWLTNVLQSRKNFYRRNRDLCIIAMVGVYLVAMVDAYVDASLSHFDISPELSMDVAPAVFQDTRGARPSLGLVWAFNF